MFFKLLKFLSNLKLAIILLLTISFFSLIGTIIEQDQNLDFYKKNYPTENPIFGFLSWKQINFFNLNQIYESWWFLLLLFIFGSCLLSCTFTQQYPSLKFFKRCRFLRNPIQFNKIKFNSTKNSVNIGKIIFLLVNNNYSIFQEKKSLYAYKGILGRVSPIIVHISIIIILIGAIQGSFSGFVVQELVPKTEIFHCQNSLKTGFTSQIPQYNFRVNDFWISYNKEQSIKQFYSNLSILDQKGKEINQKTISVNNPLRYKNLSIYQTDWTIVGIRLKIYDNLINENRIIQIPTIKTQINGNQFWLAWFKSESINISILIDNLSNYIYLYNESGQFLKKINMGDYLNFDQKIGFVDIISCTGLQIKSDPGIPIIYFGFGLLMISSLISYLSFSQIWLSQFTNTTYIGGKTNRSKIKFENELLEIQLEKKY